MLALVFALCLSATAETTCYVCHDVFIGCGKTDHASYADGKCDPAGMTCLSQASSCNRYVMPVMEDAYCEVDENGPLNECNTKYINIWFFNCRIKCKGSGYLGTCYCSHGEVDGGSTQYGTYYFDVCDN